MLEKCWKHKISGYKELPYDIVYRFEKRLKHLDDLKKIAIPRELIRDLDTSNNVPEAVCLPVSKAAVPITQMAPVDFSTFLLPGENGSPSLMLGKLSMVKTRLFWMPVYLST
ncbi:hypothetical protein TNCT_260231 [Trichonephila clavata]|uniref:Uncharacterized protein n=1 Tax=Trichonephila clavata TaxID=2740835 RepID=A0A8X6HFB7_TRICU|nr:hypothetical protein TNCT_260231 [Trichonephila clavata]